MNTTRRGIVYPYVNKNVENVFAKTLLKYLCARTLSPQALLLEPILPSIISGCFMSGRNDFYIFIICTLIRVNRLLPESIKDMKSIKVVKKSNYFDFNAVSR